MKTICTLNGRIILSQDGEALAAMETNASQYPGAVVSVVTDDEFAVLLTSQPVSTEEQRAKIAQMEREVMMPRAVREFMLAFMEANFTVQQLSGNPGYQKVKAFDNQIKAIRETL